jgi:hypothetical protein
MPVTVGKPITLQQFIKNGIDAFGTVKEFVRYDPVTNNCQRFISTLLKASAMLTPELSKFINQDAEKLLTSNFARKVGKAVTDVAAGVSQLTGGKKEKKKLIKNKLLKLKEEIMELNNKVKTTKLKSQIKKKMSQFKKLKKLYKALS